MSKRLWQRPVADEVEMLDLCFTNRILILRLQTYLFKPSVSNSPRE